MADEKIQKKYNIVSPDINPFAGTNLDAESTNTNTSNGNYNTYKNTVYKHDGSNGWVPNGTVTNGDYPSAAGVRNQMDLTSNIKIFQKEGMGTSVNTVQTDIHDKRDKKAVEVKPIEYTPNDKVEKEELNHGNWSTHYAEGYNGDFDINMKIVTTSDNQMTYRSYTNREDDVFTDMSGVIPDESIVSGNDITKGAVIEAGKHFNRGNDTKKKKTEGNKTTGVDINSSRVLDKSMFLNNFNSDILDLRGGAGIGKDGKYPTKKS